MKKGLLFLTVLLVCEQVFAAVFSVSPSDKSQQYLGMIFGSSVGGINLVASSYNATLSLMFQRFNFIIVTVGALTLSYLGVISTINTAREGEAMGKKVSMWVPLRAFTGMLLMVPSPTSGYSVVQMTVLWVILNGIGAANSVWNVVLSQLSQGVSATQGVTLTASQQTKNTVNAVLLSNACMNAVNSIPDLATAPGPYQQYGPVKIYTIVKDPVQTPIANPTSLSQNAYLQVGLQGGTNNSAPAPFDTLCGQFKVSTTISKNDGYNSFDLATLNQITKTKLAALQAMFTASDPGVQLMASNYLSSDPNYVKPQPGYVYAAQQAFIGQMSQIAQGNLPPKNITNNAYAQLAADGWIQAGSYYFELVNATTKSINPIANDTPTTFAIPVNVNFVNNTPPANWQTLSGNPTTTTAFSILNPTQATYLNTTLANAEDYYSNDVTSATSSSGISVSSPDTGNKVLNSIVKGVQSGLQDPILSYVQGIMSGSSSGKDPLLSVGNFGTILMISAELATFATIIISFVASLLVSIASCMNPGGFALITLVIQTTPILLGVFTMMWTMGATLGIYIPLIPYMMYTTSALGWIIAVIESIVAAPLIALGLTHPSGEELGKATSALVILANLFLRPTLMVFGFVMGASLLKAGIALINYGFIPALNESTAPSIFSILAVLGLYVMLIMAIVNKSFSLVYMLPNQIMRWMGGPTENFDPSDITRQAKEGFDAGASKGQSVMDTANKSLSDKGTQMGEKKASANKLAGENRNKDESLRQSVKRKVHEYSPQGKREAMIKQRQQAVRDQWVKDHPDLAAKKGVNKKDD